MQLVKLIVQIMLTVNTEIVERGEAKSQYELDIAVRVKDGVRQYAIQDIINMLGSSVL